MFRRVAYLAVPVLAFIAASCALSPFGGERRAAWRDQEERACMRSHVVQASAYVQPVNEIDGRGACGIEEPLRVSAFADGMITIGPPAMLGCPMTAELEAFMRDTVEPAALAWFGAPVIEIRQISNYSCRSKNNVHGASLSEHAFGNALDISAFRLADGRVMTVKGEWQGSPEGQGFLREVFAAGCARFKTALGPGAPYHGDHFHFDLAHHDEAGTSRYCNPKLPMTPPRDPYRGDVMAAAPQEPIELLRDPPPDVVQSSLSDPFGVYQSQQDLGAGRPMPPQQPAVPAKPRPRWLTPRAEIPMSYTQ